MACESEFEGIIEPVTVTKSIKPYHCVLSRGLKSKKTKAIGNFPFFFKN